MGGEEGTRVWTWIFAFERRVADFCGTGGGGGGAEDFRCFAEGSNWDTIWDMSCRLELSWRRGFSLNGFPRRSPEVLELLKRPSWAT